MAQIVLRHGETYAPILERLEREVEIARRDGATARARRILQEFQNKAASAEPIRLESEPTLLIGRSA